MDIIKLNDIIFQEIRSRFRDKRATRPITETLFRLFLFSWAFLTLKFVEIFSKTNQISPNKQIQVRCVL